MASSNSVGMSQKDYLKRYLTPKSTEKKKRKKKSNNKLIEKRSIVVDDDEIKTMRPLEDDELDLFQLAEDAPQIAGIIDERPDELRTLETFRSSARWRVVADENGTDDIKVTALKGNIGTQSTLEQSVDKKDEDLSPERPTRHDSDISFPRIRPLKDNIQSSIPNSRRSNKNSDSDESPPRKNKHNTSSGFEKLDKSRSLHRRKKECNPTSDKRKKHSSDSDASPPRNKIIPSSTRKNTNSDSDISLPRSKKESNPTARRRKSSDSDASPARKIKELVFTSKRKKTSSDSDISPPRSRKESNPTSRWNNDSDSNASPPRKMKQRSSTSKRKNRNSDSDISPPRSRKETDPTSCRKKYSDSDASPPQKIKQHISTSKRKKTNSDHDISPPRSRKESNLGLTSRRRKNSDSDASPPRIKRKDQALSLKQKGVHSEMEKYKEKVRSGSPFHDNIGLHRQGKHSESDKLLARHKKKHSSRDLTLERNEIGDGNSRNKNLKSVPDKKNYSDESPPTRKKRKSESPPRRKVKATSQVSKDGDSDESPVRHKSQGDISRSQDKWSGAGRGSKNSLGKTSSSNAFGGQAAPIFRDRKTGRIRNLEEEAKAKEEESKKTDEQQEKYTRWGKGLAQVAAAKVRLDDAMHEMSKPVARYADDDDLDKMLRAQDREGDPMLDYIRSKSVSCAVSSKPKYKGAWMPNRFNIPPGHRWDGVDRSCGYEKQWFEQINSRRAIEEEAHKWSVADM